jgi:hypothetical protein
MEHIWAVSTLRLEPAATRVLDTIPANIPFGRAVQEVL